MTPVTQTRLYSPSLDDPPGNCFAASAATILSLRLEDVPDQLEVWKPGSSKGASWRRYMKLFHEWLKGRGLAYLEVGDLFPQASEMVGVPCIISGKSPRAASDNVLHAVVGAWEQLDEQTVGPKILHDPHPSRAGLVSGDWTFGYFVSRFAETSP